MHTGEIRPTYPYIAYIIYPQLKVHLKLLQNPI